MVEKKKKPGSLTGIFAFLQAHAGALTALAAVILIASNAVSWVAGSLVGSFRAVNSSLDDVTAGKDIKHIASSVRADACDLLELLSLNSGKVEDQKELELLLDRKLRNADQTAKFAADTLGAWKSDSPEVRKSLEDSLRAQLKVSSAIGSLRGLPTKEWIDPTRNGLTRYMLEGALRDLGDGPGAAQCR